MKALHDQSSKLWHTTNIYMHPQIHEYAEKLVSKMPGDLKVRAFSLHEIGVIKFDTIYSRNRSWYTYINALVIYGYTMCIFARITCPILFRRIL